MVMKIEAPVSLIIIAMPSSWLITLRFDAPFNLGRNDGGNCENACVSIHSQITRELIAKNPIQNSNLSKMWQFFFLL